MPLVVLSILLGLMLAESRLSRENERRLLERGAVEPKGDVYAWMTILYPGLFVVMALEGYWRVRTGRLDLHDPATQGVFASGLLLFIASKALKYWAMRSLGELWSFRVLVVPGVTLVRTGPYAYVTHPNYLAVVGELAGAAIMMEAWFSGPAALAVFGALLWKRIRVENTALAAYQGKTPR
jgi:methyltransferase